MSTSAIQQSHRPDLSLTLIYQAVQNPTSSASLKCRNELHAATLKQLDYTLRKLKSYTKQQSQWPSRRLVRCLDYIFIHGIKPSSQLEDLVQLPSLKACVQWVFKVSVESSEDKDEDSTLLIISAVKLICALLEIFATEQLSNSTATAGILNDIKLHQGANTLLDWCQNSNNRSICIYSVRALTAQVHFFAQDLIALDAYTKLSTTLLNIPSLMNLLILKPPITDYTQKRSELEQCIMRCRLLESIFKYEQLNKPSPTRIAFAESKAFQQLVIVWHQICHFEYEAITGNHPALDKVKNGQLLIYSLTTIIQRCTSASQRAASFVAEEGPRSQWHPYMTLLMQRWIRGTCCTMNIAVITTATLNTEKSILKKVLQISLDMVPILQHHMFWIDYVDQLICDSTNFFMAFISQPILPEHAAMIGTANTLLHTNLCIDVEERGFNVAGEMLNEHQDLLVLLLESFIQHVQLATPHFIKMISGRLAWCLKSFLSILLKHQMLETSGLRTRILKLVVFFLHYYDAVDIFATSSTSITPYVWGPTIEMAKNGLVTATQLSPTAELEQQEISTIYKAKRAFVALEIISTHPRACERLMDCNVLQLVDISLVPKGDVMEKTASLLTVYALFGRLIAALSRRTAFVRTRLRDEYGLFPMMMKLIQEAIGRKEARLEKDIIAQGWNQVISSCMLVVSSFQYDESSMRMWLSWDYQQQKGDDVLTSKNEKADGDVKQDMMDFKMEQDVTIKQEEPEYIGMDDQEQITDTAGNKTSGPKSILPFVLAVLFPWRREQQQDNKCPDINAYLKSEDHRQLIILAAQVLDQLSGIPLCGRQMIIDDDALSNLSVLMTALTTAAVCQGEEVDQNGRTSNTMVICPVDKSSSSTAEEVAQEEEGGSETLNIEDFMQTDPPTEREEEEKNKEAAAQEESLNYRCAGYLRRSAIRILTCHDNIQYTILSNAFTTLFQPMLQHPSSGTSHEYWCRAICDELHEKKFGDLMSLYNFTERTGEDQSIKLHEFTAVAVGYAAIGTKTDQDWNAALGLTSLEGGIVSTKHVFGVFCQMLVYELEYTEEEDQVKKEEEEQQQGDNTLLTLISPYRRNAAAQVIEMLALEFEVIWRIETDSIQNTILIPEQIPLKTPEEIVYFSTDDSETLISGNRQLLRARSPIFEALLGSHYAEETNLAASKAIPLHDVTFHSLQLFTSVIHQLNTGQRDILDTSGTTWTDIVDLLHISDRFGSPVVKSRCEDWVLKRLKGLSDMKKESRTKHLEGLVGLYRHCRDPIEQDGGITSDTWPFATLLNESLKAMIQYLSEACRTRAFMEMVQDKNGEELDAFCDGIASLLKKK